MNLHSMRHTTTYSATLLPTTSGERFHALLKAAEPRCVCTWQEMPLGNAELLLLEGEAQTLSAGWPPCLVMIDCPVPLHVAHPSQRIFHLDADFTVASLLDVLDRAAVWLLQIRSQRPSRVERAAQMASQRYKLRRWVTLGEEWTQREYTLAIALLTREFMAPEMLCNLSGLTKEQMQRLLAELTHLDALAVEISAHSSDPPPSDFFPARVGFFTRLSRLLMNTKSISNQEPR